MKRFDHTETEKQKFHQNKEPFLMNNIVFNKIVVSNRISSGKTGFKYFIGYKDSKRLDLLVYFFQN